MGSFAQKMPIPRCGFPSDPTSDSPSKGGTLKPKTRSLASRNSRDTTLDDKKARSDAVRFAVATTEIEGGQVVPVTESAIGKWAHGKIDDDEPMEEKLKKVRGGSLSCHRRAGSGLKKSAPKLTQRLI
jgi:hypothetical protein